MKKSKKKRSYNNQSSCSLSIIQKVKKVHYRRVKRSTRNFLYRSLPIRTTHLSYVRVVEFILGENLQKINLSLDFLEERYQTILLMSNYLIKLMVSRFRPRAQVNLVKY